MNFEVVYLLTIRSIVRIVVLYHVYLETALSTGHQREMKIIDFHR